MKKKKSLSCLLAFLFLLQVFGITALAEGDSSGPISITLDKDTSEVQVAVTGLTPSSMFSLIGYYDNSVDYINQYNAGPDGTFTLTYPSSKAWVSGKVIKVQIGNGGFENSPIESEVTIDADAVTDLNITEVQAQTAITVPYGTAVADLPLPSIVTVTLENGSTAQLAVIWTSADYDAAVTATYTFSGELTLIDDITNTSNLTATIGVTVNPQAETDLEIAEVQAQTAITVPYGTAAAELPLPDKVTVALGDGSKINLAVVWEIDSYDGNTSATYTFTGELTLLDGITNTNNLKATLYVTVAQKPKGNDSGKSEKRSSGGSGSYSPALPPAFTPLDRAKSLGELGKAQASGSATLTVRQKNVSTASLALLQEIAKNANGKKVNLIADSMYENAVDVRVSFDPANATKEMTLSGSTRSSKGAAVKARFEKWFGKKVVTVQLDHIGEFGMIVKVAARVNLAGFNTDNLYFYSYDAATNIYRRIMNPKYYIDTNGYLHFYTPYGGTIVISDGPLLAKK